MSNKKTVLASTLKAGDVFRKTDGSYAYLVIGGNARRFLGLRRTLDNHVVGVAFNGNVTAVPNDLKVMKQSHMSLVLNKQNEEEFEREHGVKPCRPLQQEHVPSAESASVGMEIPRSHRAQVVAITIQLNIHPSNKN